MRDVYLAFCSIVFAARGDHPAPPVEVVSSPCVSSMNSQAFRVGSWHGCVGKMTGSDEHDNRGSLALLYCQFALIRTFVEQQSDPCSSSDVLLLSHVALCAIVQPSSERLRAQNASGRARCPTTSACSRASSWVWSCRRIGPGFHEDLISHRMSIGVVNYSIFDRE